MQRATTDVKDKVVQVSDFNGSTDCDKVPRGEGRGTAHPRVAFGQRQRPLDVFGRNSRGTQALTWPTTRNTVTLSSTRPGQHHYASPRSRGGACRGRVASADDGRRIMDAISGIGVSNLDTNPPSTAGCASSLMHTCIPWCTAKWFNRSNAPGPSAGHHAFRAGLCVFRQFRGGGGCRTEIGQRTTVEAGSRRPRWVPWQHPRGTVSVFQRIAQVRLPSPASRRNSWDGTTPKTYHASTTRWPASSWNGKAMRYSNPDASWLQACDVDATR